MAGMESVVEKEKATPAWQGELVLIASRHNGLLRPLDVVEFAKNPGTALHSKFEWDDTEAACQYRLWQARELIRVVVTVMPQNLKEYRVYVSLDEDREKEDGGYRQLVTVLSDREQRKRLLAQALREFDAWRQKYEALEELADIFSARRKM